MLIHDRFSRFSKIHRALFANLRKIPSCNFFKNRHLSWIDVKYMILKEKSDDRLQLYYASRSVMGHGFSESFSTFYTNKHVSSRSVTIERKIHDSLLLFMTHFASWILHSIDASFFTLYYCHLHLFSLENDMDTSVEKLAKEVKMTKNDLIDYANRLDFELQLGITSYHEFTRYQYDVIRGSLDMPYLARRMKRIKSPGVKRGSTHDYSTVEGFSDLVSWISGLSFNGLSTSEVREMVPDTSPSFGPQAIAAGMRAAGYESKAIITDSGKQGRRWVKVTPNTSFF